LQEFFVKASFKLFRIAGIEIGIHYTWLFIFILISWSLAEGVFSQIKPAHSTAVNWGLGIITSLALFISVLLHELAHSLVAKSRGMKVSSITLFILGGVSNLEEEPEKPGIEFSMAIVGPLTSLILGGIFWGITILIQGQFISFTNLLGNVQNPNLTAVVFGYLAWINVALAVFNLLPGFPLDGGRVLRSILWNSTHSLIRATNIAARVGQIIGWGLIGWGVFQLLSGNFLGGLWIAFIGWFLNSSADASRKEITLRERLSHIKVRDLMHPNIETISPDITIQEMVTNIFQTQHGRAVPVCENNRLVGIATISDVKKVSQDRWPATPVRQIMTTDPLYTVLPDDNLNVAMQLIAHHDINQVLINEQSKCAGIISRADIIRYIQMRHELGLPGTGSPA
jgi:Zn-dependent protease/CBS domain-containing protein